jgi:RNA-directed DNA polymerase
MDNNYTTFALQRKIYLLAKTKNLPDLFLVQDSLLKEPCTIELAIKIVTNINRGKKTAGIDGKLIKGQAAKEKIKQKILNLNWEEYNPKPVKRILIPKPNKPGETRPLGIPTIWDRILQTIIRLALEPQAEAYFKKTSFGFRPTIGVNNAITYIKNWLIKNNDKEIYICSLDINKCFDLIEHKHILNQIENPKIKNVIKKWLKAGFVLNKQRFPTKEGTPQGHAASPLLANIALHHIDCIKHPKNTIYTRYADDIIILSINKENLEKSKGQIELALKKAGLTINPSKTTINSISEGVDVLGFRITRKNKNITIKPAQKSINNLLEKIKTIWLSKIPTTQKGNITNQIIMGFGATFRFCNSSRIFKSLDQKITTLIKGTMNTKDNKNIIIKKHHTKKINCLFLKKESLYIIKLHWIKKETFIRKNFYSIFELENYEEVKNLVKTQKKPNKIYKLSYEGQSPKIKSLNFRKIITKNSQKEEKEMGKKENHVIIKYEQNTSEKKKREKEKKTKI